MAKANCRIAHTQWHQAGRRNCSVRFPLQKWLQKDDSFIHWFGLERETWRLLCSNFFPSWQRPRTLGPMSFIGGWGHRPWPTSCHLFYLHQSSVWIIQSFKGTFSRGMLKGDLLNFRYEINLSSVVLGLGSHRLTDICQGYVYVCLCVYPLRHVCVCMCTIRYVDMGHQGWACNCAGGSERPCDKICHPENEELSSCFFPLQCCSVAACCVCGTSVSHLLRHLWWEDADSITCPVARWWE